jgi:hypothetical protein
MRGRAQGIHPLAAVVLVVLLAACFSLVADAADLNGWTRSGATVVVGALLAAALLPRMSRWSPRGWRHDLLLSLPGGFYVDPFAASLDDFSISRIRSPFRRRRHLDLAKPVPSRYYGVHLGAPLVTTRGWQVAQLDRPFSIDSVLRGGLFRYWWLRAPATTGDEPSLGARTDLRPVTVITVDTKSAQRRAEAFTGALRPFEIELRIIDISADLPDTQRR